MQLRDKFLSNDGVKEGYLPRKSLIFYRYPFVWPENGSR